MAKTYKIRTSVPSEDNKYYINYVGKGYNTAIVIDDTTKSCLANCVGYAQGRYREICGDTNVWDKVGSYLAGDAKTFYDSAKKHGFKVGSKPKNACIVCWGATDGAYGHVAVVEEVYDNGDIKITESYYGGTVFYSEVLTKADGWLYRKDGKRPLLGFIYQDTDYTPENSTPKDDFVPIWNGIDYSPVFDADYYVCHYEDLKKVYYNSSKQVIFNHFLMFGMNEHRQAIPTFNVDIYKNNYEDLRNAYGDDIVKYYQHYCIFGINEHRVADKDITPKLTETSYNDYSAKSGYSYKVQKEYNKFGKGLSIGCFQSWRLAFKNWQKHKDEGFHIFSNSGKRLD